MPGPIMPIGASGGGVVIPVGTVNGADFTDLAVNWRSTATHNSGSKFCLSMDEGSTTLGVVAYARASDGYFCAQVVTFDSAGVPSLGTELLITATAYAANVFCAVMSSTKVAFAVVDSGGTLCNAAEALMQAGAVSVDAYVTHGVLSGGAVARVTSSPLSSLVTTDSIQATEAVRVAHNIRQISVAPLFGEALSRIAEEKSVSSLFN